MRVEYKGQTWDLNDYKIAERYFQEQKESEPDMIVEITAFGQSKQVKLKEIECYSVARNLRALDL